MAHRAVFFDFGGTLFSYGAVRNSFAALLDGLVRSHGIEVDRERLGQIYRRSMAETHAEFLQQPFYLHRDLFRQAHHTFLRELGVEPGVEDRDTFYDGQTRIGLERVKLREDARETVQALRTRGLHLGIVSNIDDDQFDPLWESLGLGPLFHATTTSEQARSCKPDAGIFRVALSKAGDLDPKDVVFVGDSLHHDVAGARALGMTAVLLSRSAPTAAPEPDHVISNLGALLEIVRG